MSDKGPAAPDSTAVRVALWRAQHVQPLQLFVSKELSGATRALSDSHDIDVSRVSTLQVNLSEDPTT